MTTYATTVAVSGTRPRYGRQEELALLASARPLEVFPTRKQPRSLCREGEGDRVQRLVRIALPREAAKLYLVPWQVAHPPSATSSAIV